MVGVPGRSNACHTCRQRKIRCGGERPTCANCAKSRRACGGYQKKQAFILSQYVTGSDSSLKNDILSTTNQDGTAPVLLRRWKKSEAVSQAPVPLRENTAFISRMTAAVSPRHVFRDQLLSLFIDLQCPSVGKGVTRFNGHFNWLLQLPTIQLSAALEHALMANCWAKLGRQGRHEPLVRKSLLQYTAGLRELQAAISRTELCFNEQNIASCVALIMYEFSECPGSATDGYMNHYNGAMELIHRRGPDAHTMGLAHGIFQVLRMHTVYQSFGRRRKSFLVQPDWIQKPWSSVQKGAHDLLIDILLQVPEIFENMDAGAEALDPKISFSCYSSALEECLHLDKCLSDWFSSYQATASGPLYWPNLSNANSVTDDTDLGKLFPVAFEFPSFGVGETLVLFWTAQVLIYSHLSMLSRKINRRDTNTGRFPNTSIECFKKMESGIIVQYLPESDKVQRGLQHQGEWTQQSARYICQSSEYFLQEKLSHIGAGVMLPALMVVQSCLSLAPGDWARETLWIREKIAFIRQMGVNLAGQL